MPKYLFQVSYTVEGVNGLLGSGGSARQEALSTLIESAGGSMEVFYYAFGDDDLYIIAELPDDAAATAVSLRIAAAGGGTVKTTVLLEPSVVDAATKRIVDYTPPGG